MCIAVIRKNVTKSRQVYFQRDAKPFVGWLATAALLGGPSPSAGTSPDTVKTLLHRPWKSLEVECALYKDAKPIAVGARYTRDGERVRVATFLRAGEQVTNTDKPDVSAAELPAALDDVLKQYTAAFNDHTEVEESVGEQTARGLYSWALYGGGEPFICMTGEINIRDPAIVITLTGPEGKTRVSNAFDLGFLNFLSFFQNKFGAELRW
jgi:hypothetical protein